MGTKRALRRTGVVGAGALSLVFLGGGIGSAALADTSPLGGLGSLTGTVAGTIDTAAGTVDDLTGGAAAPVTGTLGTVADTVGSLGGAAPAPGGAPATDPITGTVDQVVKTVTDTVEKVVPAPLAGIVNKILPTPAPAQPTSPPAAVPLAPVAGTAGAGGATTTTTTAGTHPTRTTTAVTAPDRHPAAPASAPTSAASSAGISLVGGLGGGFARGARVDSATVGGLAGPQSATLSAGQTPIAAPAAGHRGLGIPHDASDSLPGLLVVLATVVVGTVGAAHVGLLQRRVEARAHTAG